MKPNSQRAKNAIIGLYVAMGAAAIMLLTEFYTLFVLTGAVPLSYDMYSFYDGVMILGAVINLGAYVACAIVFIQWFRRAYYNLHKLIPSSQLRYSEGWAAGAWFIPIFSLFGPYQIATDLFKKSENLLVENNMMDRKPGLHKIAGWWWGLWVTHNVLGNISSRMDTNIDIATAGAVLDIIGSFITLGSAYLAIQMIKNYAPMEELLKKIPGKTSGPIHITNDDLLDSGI